MGWNGWSAFLFRLAMAGFAARGRRPPLAHASGAGIQWRISRATFRKSALAPEFPRSRARSLRVNGLYGLRTGGSKSPIREVDPSTYQLHVSWPGGEKSLDLAAVKALPRVEQTVEFKCIEGWSQVVHWAGARFADLAEPIGLNSDSIPYVALDSIGGGYYVGLDLPSALHSQTLLAYELNGEPLTPAHGAPLRLVIPVKYGIKNIKQLASIRFTEDRPRDFWAERGYDWYAGL